ncbi:MAG: GNAT family N-acetyltransferase, partial [Chloroflexota bacterium]
GTLIRDDDELFWYVTGLPDATFNSIMYANLAPDRIDAAVNELRRLRAIHRVPINWLIGPTSRPFDLPAQLMARGFRHLADLTPMTRSIVEPLPAAEPVPGLSIERVVDAAALTEWIAAERRGFEMEGRLADEFAALRRAIGIEHGRGLYHLLGRLDGVPVATASIMLAGGIAGIFDVSTVPRARRRGIGTAMTLAALTEARAYGYEIAFLQPSEMGEPIYYRLGFRVCCVCGIYG